MQKVQFSGRIVPTVHGLDMSDSPTIYWKDNDYKVDITIHVSNSQITVDCEVETFRKQDLYEIYKRAIDTAKACVDLGSFATGEVYLVVLETYTDPDGKIAPLTFGFPQLGERCTLLEMGKPGFSEIFNLLLAEPGLMWALRDLIETIETPNRTCLNCGRVIEAIRTQISPDKDPEDSKERKEAWKKMREELQLSESCTNEISDKSKLVRHGKRIQVDGITTGRIHQNTWTIVNRALAYRLRGSKTLPLAEFPLLT